MGKTFVITLGGNSILRQNEKGSIEEQYSHIWETAGQLLAVINGDNRVVVSHGNGPQVGNILLANEYAQAVVPPMTLAICGAATQGFMGYMIQETLANRLREAGFKHNITTVISQVIVDSNDPALKNPTKPIGPFYDLQQANELMRDKGWKMIKDGIRGYRRVVPSPRPIQIQQSRIIKAMLDNDETVIACGGGGIPSIREANGNLRGIEAVIDKDYTSSRLAVEIDADVIVCLTSVEKVYLDFDLTSRKALDRLSVDEARRFLEQGQFGVGNMEPKIRAATEFLEATKESDLVNERRREVIITLPEKLTDALRGKTGTVLTI